MDNPFKLLTDAFQADYRVNFSVERLDGSIMLTLSNEKGIVARRVISGDTLADQERMRRFIQSVQFGIAIEHGDTAVQLLADMVDGGMFGKPAVVPHHASPSGFSSFGRA